MNRPENKYRVPDDYFSTLEASILSQTVDKKPEPKSRLRSIRPILGIAASIILIAVCAYLLWPQSSQTDTSDQYAELEDQLFDELFAEDVLASDDVWDEMASFLVELDEQ